MRLDPSQSVHQVRRVQVSAMLRTRLPEDTGGDTAGQNRPSAPDLIMRSFAVPRTRATHVRLRVLSNQCTGGPAYQGDQDDDPANSTDCDETTLPGFNLQATRVRAAELQVFSD